AEVDVEADERAGLVDRAEAGERVVDAALEYARLLNRGQRAATLDDVDRVGGGVVGGVVSRGVVSGGVVGAVVDRDRAIVGGGVVGGVVVVAAGAGNARQSSDDHGGSPQACR